MRAFRRVHRLSRARARTRVIEGVTRSDIRLTRVVNACIHQRCEAISDNACRRSPVGTAHQPPPPRRPRGLGASSSPEGLAAIQAHPRAHARTRNREVRGYPTPSNAIQTLGPGRGPRHARSPGRTSSRAHVLARAIEKERGAPPPRTRGEVWGMVTGARFERHSRALAHESESLSGTRVEDEQRASPGYLATIDSALASGPAIPSSRYVASAVASSASPFARSSAVPRATSSRP